MSESLILISHDSNTVAATAAARQLIEEALALGALIGSVRNAEQNQAAVDAQVALKTVRKQIEDAYRACKDPLVQLGRKLDITFKMLVEEIDKENGRIAHLAGEFGLAEKRRLAAEAILAQQKLDALEAEKHAAIAATPDPVKQVHVMEDFSRRQAMELPLPVAPVRATGQKIREEWDIRTINIIECAKWALMTGRWDVLSIEVRKSVVKELLEGGMTSIPGLECKKVSKAGVALPRAQKAIDV